jgi:hypothetical protein
LRIQFAKEFLYFPEIGEQMEHRILNGWKEISSHIERGARTAQRWELQFGMPVHRPANNRRTAVVAFADELDMWLLRDSKVLHEGTNVSDETDLAGLQETLFRLQFEAKALVAKLLRLEQHLHETTYSNGNASPQRNGMSDANPIESLSRRVEPPMS